jgi:hypothetical protein
MSGRRRIDCWRIARRGMALLDACVIALIASASVQATSPASFLVVEVTVVRSCRISTDSPGADGTPLQMTCASDAARPQIDLGPTPPGGAPIRSTAEGMIASARPTRLHEPRAQPATMRLTINF